MSAKRDIRAELQAPFHANEIEWRVQQAGVSNNGKPYAMVLCYVTNRAIMNRLDDVFGLTGWQNKFNDVFTSGSHIVECGIGVKVKEDFIWKWDAAEETQIDAVKGGRSGAMKRAAVQWGIGRYLYSLESNFAVCFEDTRSGMTKQKFQKTRWDAASRKKVPDGNAIYGSWNPPQLPSWALPEGAQQ